jgi:hypothetical protein
VNADAPIEDDPSIPPETVLWRLVHEKQTVLNADNRRRPSSNAFDDNTDGPYHEPMSAFIADECGDPHEMLKLVQGRFYAVKFTVGFARSLGLGVVRRDISNIHGHVVITGGLRKKITHHDGKSRKRQWIFAHSFNQDEDWVLAPPDA